MSNLNPVTRSATHVAAPTDAELKPQPLQYTAQQASPAAAIDSVQADAAKGNMVANMHGGWVPDKRGIVQIITKVKASKKRSASSSSRSSSSRSGSKSRSRTIRRGGKRGRRFRKQGRSFKRRVSRRIRMRLLERHIKKHSIGSNAMMQKMMRGGTSAIGDGDTVPQHGASCSGDADPNCPGLAAASLLTAGRQSTANAHGDSTS